ncbi:hypothetical protein [Faecalispora anaeroviscerum]|uniref:hypothetical protein n=1 Tax=Faecalispora anaeroviscerum TaxID=2991836 RepID=UPI0024BB7F4B|nr:hypothetical protein [Faecalispora anaeroviscerum]
MPIPRWGLITLGVVVVLGLAVFIPYRMMLTDDLAGKYNPAPSQDLLRPAAKAMLTGDPVVFSEAEVNAYAAYHLQDVQNYLSKAKFQPNQIYLTFPEEDTVTAYTPITWRGKNLGVTSQCKVVYDAANECLNIEVRQVRLGRLNVSPKFALNRMFAKELPNGITRVDNMITVDLKPYLESERAVQAGFSLGLFKVQENGVLFQASSTLSDAGSKLKERLKEWLGESFTGDSGDLAGRLQDYLKKSRIS